MNPKLNRELEDLCINTIRILSADAVQNANAGLPACRWALLQWPTLFGRSAREPAQHPPALPVRPAAVDS